MRQDSGRAAGLAAAEIAELARRAPHLDFARALRKARIDGWLEEASLRSDPGAGGSGRMATDQEGERGMTQTIETPVTRNAVRQMQRRGVRQATLTLVLAQADRSRKLAGAVRALWISAAKGRQLVRQGVPAGEVERARRVRVIVSLMTDAVITCEHATRRRRWA